MKKSVFHEFHRYFDWLQWPIHLVLLAMLAYTWIASGSAAPDALVTLVALLVACLITSIRWTATQVRKRRNAGIVNFQYEHTPSHAERRLRELSDNYFYVGRSFESMLQPFESARSAGGMAQRTRLKLLLANPDDPSQIDFLRCNTPGNLTAEQTAQDLRGRLLRTLAALDGFGRVEIGLHSHPYKGWLHLFDDDSIVFGMTPRGIDGLSAPALELEEVAGRWTLFNHFRDWAEDAWKRRTKIEDIAAWKKKLESFSR